MIITHASSQKIVKVLKPSEFSVYGMDVHRGCLFFGSEDNDYNLAGHVKYQYNLEVDENKILGIGYIQYTHSHEDKIVKSVLSDMKYDLDLEEISDETLLDILDDCKDILDYKKDDEDETGRLSWLTQQYQGILAHKLGYDAAESEDEQGTVYIVYSVNRELQEIKY